MGSNGPTWGNRHIQVRMARDAIERAKRQRDMAQSEVDRLTCVEWNYRMSLLRGPVQPSPTLGQAINGGYPWLRCKCSGCRQTAWIDLRQVRRPSETPIWRMEGALACTACRRGRQRAPRAVIEELCRERGLIRPKEA